MKPFQPVEVLAIIDERDREAVAVFTRMTEFYWAKPGALMMYSLDQIESDRKEYHRVERHILS